MCNHSDDCRCLRYIPQDNPPPGPRLCRDCEHWESEHPEAAKSSAMASVLSQYLPQIQKVRAENSTVSDKDARREAGSGFRKSNDESVGRGGNTRFVKKRGKNNTNTTSDDIPIALGRIMLLPNPVWPTEDDTDADDVQEMGVATVPNVTRTQQLKDAGLVVETDDFQDGISFKKSWSAERIDRFMHHYFPLAFGYQEEKHRDLEDGDYHWVALSADRKKLMEFKKKDPINGRDLFKLKSGKGKDQRESTLYFALRLPIPDKIWSNNWGANTSDDEWTNKSKSKSKSKVVPGRQDGVSTRSTSRKVELAAEEIQSDSGGSVVEVEPPTAESPGPSSHAVTSTSKDKTETSRIKAVNSVIKLEPELAETANKEYLELDNSDSDTEPFPLTAVSPKAAVNIATSAGSGQTVLAGLLTSTGANLISTSTVAPTSIQPSCLSGPSPFSIVPSVPASAFTAVTPSGDSQSLVFRPPPTLTSASSLFMSLADHSSSYGRSTGRTSSVHASGSASTSHGPFSAENCGRHYASSTDTLQTFNESGNYREGTPPKRPFAAVMSSGFPSPERPLNNPWIKRRKTGN
ncbi:hypothetical protein DFH07DRAFT_765411 [Mycena maculata]|uniref:Uncharacterized protein n=1 Tax=Mycena maculata TaxID=230809 RepID=A0AAD7KCA8_9AGAR|nr:hypothetical protein DFH07DRAFT_765411 [Mycena maculata]